MELIDYLIIGGMFISQTIVMFVRMDQIEKMFNIDTSDDEEDTSHSLSHYGDSSDDSSLNESSTDSKTESISLEEADFVSTSSEEEDTVDIKHVLKFYEGKLFIDVEKKLRELGYDLINSNRTEERILYMGYTNIVRNREKTIGIYVNAKDNSVESFIFQK